MSSGTGAGAFCAHFPVFRGIKTARLWTRPARDPCLVKLGQFNFTRSRPLHRRPGLTPTPWPSKLSTCGCGWWAAPGPAAKNPHNITHNYSDFDLFAEAYAWSFHRHRTSWGVLSVPEAERDRNKTDSPRAVDWERDYVWGKGAVQRDTGQRGSPAPNQPPPSLVHNLITGQPSWNAMHVQLTLAFRGRHASADGCRPAGTDASFWGSAIHQFITPLFTVLNSGWLVRSQACEDQHDQNKPGPPRPGIKAFYSPTDSPAHTSRGFLARVLFWQWAWCHVARMPHE